MAKKSNQSIIYPSRGLCDYSSSSEDENEPGTETTSPQKAKSYNADSNTQVLQVPKSIKNMYNKTDETLNGPPPSLDATKHGLRTRTFPHTRGNWATTIYIKIPDKIKDEIEQIQIWLSTKTNEILKRQHGDELLNIHIENDPHISLTKVGVTLQLHWISDFTATLKEKFKRLKSSYVTFGEVQMFMNESNTRIFIGLQTFADELSKYVSNIDGVLQDFGQPIFYQTPKFHTSLLWCLPFDYEENDLSINQDCNKVNIIEKRFDVIIKELNKEYSLAIENEELDASGFWVSTLSAKIGNKTYQFDLDA